MPSRGCSEAAWTDARFSPGAINSSNQAIDILKKQYQAKELILIGYSGGGAVASLIAVQRSDIKELVTVAGNLDTDVWVKYFGLNPLAGSLNPADKVKQLSATKQTHFIGEKDQVIPIEITRDYLKKLTKPNQSQLIEIKEYGHVCCWQENWTALLNRIQQ
jgi:pimeloyl-ACP methyl ester carboxylesterase